MSEVCDSEVAKSDHFFFLGDLILGLLVLMIQLPLFSPPQR